MKQHPAWGRALENVGLALAASVDIGRVRTPAFAVLNALQRHPPSLQIEAAFLAAVAMASAAGIDPHELVERAIRQIPDAEAPYTDQVQAIKDYVKGEIG